MEHLTLDKTISLYPGTSTQGYAWGMAIDLNTCTGCSACVVACLAENNIPVVGKEQVAAGREMHWMRIDRYYKGEPRQPGRLLPADALHAVRERALRAGLPGGGDHAHDEGLNDMVYNRCVGTRYCSNNCPYKVRRFNFFSTRTGTRRTFKLQRNPDVTVRSRGVMEKCTYCVQRINAARSRPSARTATIRDGEIADRLPGGVPDRRDRVRRHQRPEQPGRGAQGEPAQLRALAELNTRPRTTYLAAVRNPNPDAALEPAASAAITRDALSTTTASDH